MDDLLDQIEKFIEKHDMEVTAFGKAALNDPSLVRDLKFGRALRKKTRRKVVAFMDNYQPSLTSHS